MVIVTCRMEIANTVDVRQLSVIQEKVINTYSGGVTLGLRLCIRGRFGLVYFQSRYQGFNGFVKTNGEDNRN